LYFSEGISWQQLLSTTTCSCVSASLPHPQALKKSLAGQVTLFPVWLGTFFTAMAVLEGRGLEGGMQKLRDNFGTTLVSGSVFWWAGN
jgi:hypothetical protein